MTNVKRKTAFILAALMLLVSLAACAPTAVTPEDPTPAPATEVPTEAPEDTPAPAETAAPAGEEIVLTKENFDEEIAGDTPILVDFWASWCGPCMQLAPIVEELAKLSDGSYRVGKVNVDEQIELAERFEISAIPLVIVFRNGEEVARNLGLTDRATLEALIESAKGE